MSEIHIRRRHGLTLKKARSAAETIARELEEEYRLVWNWEGETLYFERGAIHGQLTVGRHQVEIVVRMGFLLFGLRPIIERELNQYCDAQFGKDSHVRVG